MPASNPTIYLTVRRPSRARFPPRGKKRQSREPRLQTTARCLAGRQGREDTRLALGTPAFLISPRRQLDRFGRLDTWRIPSIR